MSRHWSKPSEQLLSRGKKKPRYRSKRKKAEAEDAPIDFSALQRLVEVESRLDEEFGYSPFVELGGVQTGWLLNMQPTLITDRDTSVPRSAVNYYFVDHAGNTFKAAIAYSPYFYLHVKPTHYHEVETYLQSRFPNLITKIDAIDKVDLDTIGHLSGEKKTYMRISFNTVQALVKVRRALEPIVKHNKAWKETADVYNAVDLKGSKPKRVFDSTWHIIDIREYDVTYYMRAAIDSDLRVGYWYDVKHEEGEVKITRRDEILERAHTRVFAFDIECTKAPLKFPDPLVDVVMMISYMIDGRGFLIVNRTVVSADIDDFEYTPKTEFPGPFTVWNVADEVELLRKFFSHIRQVKPHIFVTYNGDGFDWPFVEARANAHGINMGDEIGVVERNGEYRCRFASHMDAFKWVERDSYLPQGSRGLKAVTKYKLGYDPLELDPERMTPLARSDPQTLASYSVSDAVCTFYLYKIYVHGFIYSLCNIIPMNPDDVLRKGSGTLCETLLMVEAYRADIIYPNKHKDKMGKLYKGHLLESETYIGGHVECLQSGIYHANIQQHFTIDTQYVMEELVGMQPDGDAPDGHKLDELLSVAMHELNISKEDVSNYHVVRQEIFDKLCGLAIAKKRKEEPLIYHLDVSAMYPNIILTNRLQPSAVVHPETCAVCPFNRPGMNCQLQLEWMWRGDYIDADRAEYNLVKSQLQHETFDKPKKDWRDSRKDNAQVDDPFNRSNDEPAKVGFFELPELQRLELLKERLRKYAHAAHGRQHVVIEEERSDVVCMREHPFYVDTVRAFRDRRYEFKGLLKRWQGLQRKAKADGASADLLHANEMVVLYDSLQLAHKCILNSFYGYVMRRGARWYSMEMAGMVTHMGARIIMDAKEIVDRVGIPLELDTDGIWCCLPRSFPENYQFEVKAMVKGVEKVVKKVFSFPCVMLNKSVREKFSNEQYHTMDRERPEVLRNIHTENSIEFEVDGPYKAMVIPASKDSDKKLKKRYAVFSDDNKLVELKGFEIKRRGELKLIKIFQSEIFEMFLVGNTVSECYAACASVADRWLDVLYTRGEALPDEELLDLITESRSMSRKLADYAPTQKSTSITTAKRLADFLGPSMVEDKGLSCQFIISRFPAGAKKTERALPIVIFKEHRKEVRNRYLRKWCGGSADLSSEDELLRHLIDWDYYKERLGFAIQKIITIPAALQGVDNPVPRVPHPAWLVKKLRMEENEGKQSRLTSFFSKRHEHDRTDHAMVEDMEDMVPNGVGGSRKRSTMHRDEGDGDVDGDGDGDGDGDESPEPDRQSDPGAWHRWQKDKWRRLRAHRRSRKKERERARILRTGGLGGAMHQREMEAALTKPWQVVEIASTASTHRTGEFTIWAMVDRELHRFQLVVDRRFFVNSYVEWDWSPSDGAEGHAMDVCDGDDGPRTSSLVDASVASVVRTERHLPRGRAQHHLYEVRVSQEVYHAHHRELQAQFAHPQIEGVYASRVPLVMRAIMGVGALCRVTRAARDARLRHAPSRSAPFRLDELERVPFASSSGDNVPMPVLLGGRGPKAPTHYLGKGTHRTIFLYVCVARVQRHDIGVVAMFSSHSAEARVWLVDPHKLMARARATLMDACTALLAREHGGLEYVVHRVPSSDAAYQAARRHLGSALDGSHGPTYIITQSVSTSKAELRRRLPPLTRLPHIAMPANAQDARTMGIASSWELFACRMAVRRWLDAGEWFVDVCGFARYASVPVGNLCSGGATDYTLAIADVLFARRLVHQAQVLWVNDRPKPDLGGAEEDDNVFSAAAASDEVLLAAPQVECPGLFGTVCVEIDLKYLGVNTILVAAMLHQLEGHRSLLDPSGPEGLDVGGAAFDFAATHHHQSTPHPGARDLTNTEERVQVALRSGADDGTLTMGRVFNILKALVTQWSLDVGETAETFNVYAEALIEHFFRWVSSPEASCYEPALHKLVYGQMKKVFLQLIGTLRKLGCKVVYADYNRLVLCTNKPDVHTARAYVDFVLSTIADRELFQFLRLKAVKYWDTLLFLDRANYGGVVCPPEDDGGEDGDGIVSHWTLAEYLPRTLQPPFVVSISEFIAHAHAHKDTLRALKAKKLSAGQRAISGAHARGTTKMHFPMDAEEDGGGGAAGLITSEFTQRLLRMTQEIRNSAWTIREKQKELVAAAASGATRMAEQRVADDGEDGPPSRFHLLLADPTTPQYDPALEFVKYVCKVLGAEKVLDDSVTVLRKTLMRLIGVRSFSPEAEFSGVHGSFVLSAVICGFCSSCRDMDLLRDIDLMHASWTCRECGHAYNKTAVEATLVDVVQKKSLAYQLQDLACAKCGLVKAENLLETCPACAGPYVPTESPEKFKSSLKTFSKIALVHQFPKLGELTEWLLTTHGAD